MIAFWRTLARNLRALPGNLARDLRPLPARSDDPRVRIRRAFLYHLHPRTVTERALDPFVTLGLGVASAVLFACLCISGALLMIYYLPSVDGAYASILDIDHAVWLGPFVRALHRYTAHAMVVTVVLHLIRVLAMGAYRRRELNWFFGLGLLLLTLGLAFTGYLLPWDQRAYWAVTVSANLADHLPWLGPELKQLLLGGDRVGQATLLRFYMLHVALLPTGLLLLVLLHLWRIRRDDGLAVEPATAAPAGELAAWPHLVLREGILALAILAGFCLLAALVAAPLGAPPDFHHPSNPEKAPWYFVWVQEMVSYSAPVGGVIYPLLTGLWLSMLPWLDRDDRDLGRWFGAGRQRRVVLISALAGLVGFALLAWAHLGTGPPAATWQADLFNPASGMIGLSLLAFVLAGWASGSTRVACQAALLVLLIGILGCLVLGACRGPDWAFFWPWEEWPLGV